MRGNGNYAAGDQQGEDAHLVQGRENAVQFAMADHRFPADQGDVQGLVLAHKAQYAIDQLISAEVIEFAQRDAAAEMRIAIGVASRAAQRALPGDLDRQHRDSARQDSSPSGEHVAGRKTWFGCSGYRNAGSRSTNRRRCHGLEMHEVGLWFYAFLRGCNQEFTSTVC